MTWETHEVASLLHMAFVRGFNAGRATRHIGDEKRHFNIRSKELEELGKYVDELLERRKKVQQYNTPARNRPRGQNRKHA
jgi:hypothetical protein